MSEDERAIRERLAALESEVKAETSAQRARKDALDQARAERVAAARKPAAAPAPKSAKAAAKAAAKAPVRKQELEDELSALEELAAPRRKGRADLAGDVGSALELARRAQGMKAELTRPVKKGEKSWLVSAGLSTMLGPVGWLYAGSWREAAPAAAAWVALGYLLSFLPTMLMLPALMVAMPLSGLAGVMYALGFNREGKRQRLFGEDKAGSKKALRSSSTDEP